MGKDAGCKFINYSAKFLLDSRRPTIGDQGLNARPATRNTQQLLLYFFGQKDLAVCASYRYETLKMFSLFKRFMRLRTPKCKAGIILGFGQSGNHE